MDEHRFDALAKRLAVGGTSRRRLLQGLGGALLGAALGASRGVPTAAQGPRCRYHCLGICRKGPDGHWQQTCIEENCKKVIEECEPNFTLFTNVITVGTNVLYRFEDAGRVVSPGGTTANSVGIDCGTLCKNDFSALSPVRLIATPAAGWTFDGWEGDCAGAGPTATVSIDLRHWVPGLSRSCTARFRPNPARTFSPDILTTNYANPPFDESNPYWSSNVCSGRTIDSVTSGFAGPELEWMPILRGVGVRNFDEINTHPVAAAGTALKPQFSSKDCPFTHPFGLDWEFYIALDAAYASLLASSNGTSGSANASPGAFQDTTMYANQLGLFSGWSGPQGVLGVETDQGLVPDTYQPQDKDRVVVYGRWIVDCGEPDFHTEIHPPLLLLAAHGVAAGEGTRATVISNPYLVSQIFDGAGWLRHLMYQVGDLYGVSCLLTFLGVGCRVEAHPTLYRVPFAGRHVVDFLLRPPTPRRCPTDRLQVSFHLTGRQGVTVGIYDAGGDRVGMRVTLDSTVYPPAPLPPRSDLILSVSDIKNLNDTAGDYLEGALYSGPAVNLNVTEGLARGIVTDTYIAPDVQFLVPPPVDGATTTRSFTGGGAIPPRRSIAARLARRQQPAVPPVRLAGGALATRPQHRGVPRVR